MILVCPLCQTRYLVPANIFAAGPRAVRCAKCKHNWKAAPDKNIDVVAALEEGLPPPPDEAAPIPEGSNLPALTKKRMSPIIHNTIFIIAGAMFALALVWLILDRQHIAKRWSSMEPLYNAVGLYIYYPGDGLEFDQVRSELRYDGGITKLILDGKIENKTKKNQKVPDIIAEAIGPDGAVIQSWQIDAPKATLGGEEEVGFSSLINAPKGTVVNVTLNFVELKDDN